MPASQHSCAAKRVAPVARGPDNGVGESEQGATGDLVFRNFILTVTVVRMGRDHRGSGSAKHPTWGSHPGDEPKENEKDSQTRP